MHVFGEVVWGSAGSLIAFRVVAGYSGFGVRLCSTTGEFCLCVLLIFNDVALVAAVANRDFPVLRKRRNFRVFAASQEIRLVFAFCVAVG